MNSLGPRYCAGLGEFYRFVALFGYGEPRSRAYLERGEYCAIRAVNCAEQYGNTVTVHAKCTILDSSERKYSRGSDPVRMFGRDVRMEKSVQRFFSSGYVSLWIVEPIFGRIVAADRPETISKPFVSGRRELPAVGFRSGFLDRIFFVYIGA